MFQYHLILAQSELFIYFISIRYPNDVYDRIWGPLLFDNWIPIATNSTIYSSSNDNPYNLPDLVLRTAVHQILFQNIMFVFTLLRLRSLKLASRGNWQLIWMMNAIWLNLSNLIIWTKEPWSKMIHQLVESRLAFQYRQLRELSFLQSSMLLRFFSQ